MPGMTPALSTPIILKPPRSSLFDRLRLSRRQLAGGLALGVLTELFLDGAAYGASVVLFSLALGGAFIAQGGREGWESAREHRWLLLAAMALMSTTVLHDSTWFSVLTTLAALILASLAALGWTGERSLSTLRTGALLAAPFKVGGLALYAGAVASHHELGTKNVGTTVQRIAWPALRMGLIVVPPVLILAALLAGADAGFAQRLEGIARVVFEAPIERVIRGGFIIGVSGVVLSGVLVLANRRRAHVEVSAPRRLLRLPEALTLLGALTATLLLYGVTPSAPATTYSQAANEGFFQLLFAALGIVVVLMALPARTKLETDGHARWLSAFSTALVVAAIPMVASGVARLWRYEQAYGLTRLRLLAYAGLALVIGVLAWRAITQWVLQRHFVAGGLALCTVTMLTLGILGPDRLIAERNVQRAETDLGYLSQLSADAIPALATRDAALAASALERVDTSVLSWNLARWQAQQTRSPGGEAQQRATWRP